MNPEAKPAEEIVDEVTASGKTRSEVVAEVDAIIASGGKKSLADNQYFRSIAIYSIGVEIEMKHPVNNCKHCHGRGYTGIHKDTKAPQPCNCAFISDMGDANQFMQPNRKSRRKHFNNNGKKNNYGNKIGDGMTPDPDANLIRPETLQGAAK